MAVDARDKNGEISGKHGNTFMTDWRLARRHVVPSTTGKVAPNHSKPPSPPRSGPLSPDSTLRTSVSIKPRMSLRERTRPVGHPDYAVSRHEFAGERLRLTPTSRVVLPSCH